MPAAPRAASAAPQRSASGTAEKEKTPLLRAAATATAPTSTGRPSPRFLGLYLWQWGLVALGALCLYGLYLVGGYFAWRRGGNGYHDVAITLGCLSGVRASQARGGCEKRACAAARHRGLLCALLSMRSLADPPPPGLVSGAGCAHAVLSGGDVHRVRRQSGGQSADGTDTDAGGGWCPGRAC